MSHCRYSESFASPFTKVSVLTIIAFLCTEGVSYFYGELGKIQFLYVHHCSVTLRIRKLLIH